LAIFWGKRDEQSAAFGPFCTCDMTAPLLVMAAGGTGGHMFPAQALAEAMLARGWRVKLSTDARGARYTGAFPEGVEIEVLASATFARGGVLAKLGVPFKIARGVLAAVFAFRRDRPDAVIGFGGYPTIPALSAAWLMGLPRLIHEQNGVLGKVNQIFARRVDAVACGTWPTTLHPGVKGQDIGNPVRAVVGARAGAPYTPPGDYPMKLVVIGGSQGARILSQVVPEAVADLPDAVLANLTVVQQARDEDAEAVRAAYARIGVRADVAGFIDVPAAFAEAQLIISRAGASSIADIAAIGRPAILVPYAAATADHQTANAHGLVEAGAAIAFQERDFTADALSKTLETLLTQPDEAQRMAAAAHAQAKLDATERLVTLIETLAKKGPPA